MMNDSTIYGAACQWVDEVMTYWNGVHNLTPRIIPEQPNEDATARMLRECFQAQEVADAERRFREAERLYLQTLLNRANFRPEPSLMRHFLESEKHELLHLVNLKFGNEGTQALLDGGTTDIRGIDSTEGLN